MAVRPLKFVRNRWLLLFIPTCVFAQIPLIDRIFDGGFEAHGSNPVPGALAFQNDTDQYIQQPGNSGYRFDALWVDFNSDGCLDAFIFDHKFDTPGGPTSRLWLNRCDGSSLLDLASNADVNYYIPSPMSPRGSGWLTALDFDGDGREDFWTRDADVAAARYRNGSTAGPTPYFSGKELACEGRATCAFADITGVGALQVINQKRQVEDMMTRAVVLPASGDDAFVVIGDVTGNGWPDIIQPRHGGYWRNDGGELAWHAVPAFRGGHSGQMLLADFDNDGDMDLLVVDTRSCNDSTSPVSKRVLVFRNDGHGGFTDISSSTGDLAQAPADDCLASYGNVIAGDFDNDGFQDIVFAGASHSSTVRVFRNDGNMRFTRSNVNFGPSGGQGPDGWIASAPRAAVGDFDNDGKLDIIKTQHPGNIGIWRNLTDTGGANWMKARIRGDGQNADGVGANVRWYRTGTSQILANLTVQVGDQHPQKWLHTGLAGHALVDVEVHFPNGGASYRFNEVEANQEIIVFANGCLIQHWQPGNGWPRHAPAGCGS